MAEAGRPAQAPATFRLEEATRLVGMRIGMIRESMVHTPGILATEPIVTAACQTTLSLREPQVAIQLRRQ